MINSKYWLKKIDNDNNWWTEPKNNNKEKNCVQHNDTLAPVIKRKRCVENIFALLQLDNLVNLSNYKTIIYFSKWFIASLERKLNKYSRLPITGTFKENRKEFELLGFWCK